MQQTVAEDFASAAAKVGDLGCAKENNATLRFCVGGAYHYYNFVMRVLFSTTGSSAGGCTITPFSQLDRDSLEFMHSKLTELGGNPPALPTVREVAPLPKFRMEKP